MYTYMGHMLLLNIFAIIVVITIIIRIRDMALALWWLKNKHKANKPPVDIFENSVIYQMALISHLFSRVALFVKHTWNVTFSLPGTLIWRYIYIYIDIYRYIHIHRGFYIEGIEMEQNILANPSIFLHHLVHKSV